MDFTDELIEVLGNKDTLFLIGSGLSMNSGLPSWGQLLENLINKCDDEGIDTTIISKFFNNQEYLDAAQMIFDNLDKIYIDDELEKLNVTSENDYHRSIIGFPSKKFITTNYDRLIEYHYDQKFGNNIEIILNSDENKYGKIFHNLSTEYVYKYHGDIGDKDNIVLTLSNYQDMLFGNSETREVIEDILKQKVIVSFGFGLKDADFIVFLKRIIPDFGKIRNRMYAFMDNIDPLECLHYEKHYNIKIIPYKTKDSGRDHSELLDKISSFQEIINQAEPVKLGKYSHNQTAGTIEQKLNEIDRQHQDLKKNIIGINSALAPISKEDLYSTLGTLNFPIELTRPISEVLAQEGLLRDSDSVYIPVDEPFTQDAEDQVEGLLIELLSSFDGDGDA